MNLLIRSDASSRIGTGHVMRCLALAQASQDSGGHATFVTATETPALDNRLRAEEFEVYRLGLQPGSARDATETARLARHVNASWVVVDGYHFDAEYQRRIKDSGLQLLFIDDNGHAQRYHADVVLNQNIHAHEGFYANRDSHTRLLLGADYMLLRREFLMWDGREPRVTKNARKVLVTLGGGDQNNLTLKVIKALGRLDLPDLHVAVIVGPANSYLKVLQHEAQTTKNVEIMTAVSDMPFLMAWADVAISSGGVTCYELMFMGVPTLVAVLADNQRPVAQGLSDVGVVINLGWHEKLQGEEIAQAMSRLLISDEDRSEMILRMRSLIDGDGARRVLMRLNGQGLKLRRANTSDCRLVWEWANSPEVRAASFSSEEIPFAEHMLWYNEKIASPNCLFYIASNEQDVPVGQVRFEMNADEVVISIAMASDFRGKGMGSIIIDLASRELFSTTDATLIHAYIKGENGASLRAFSRAGFHTVEQTEVGGPRAVHMTLDKSDVAGCE